MSPPSTLCGKFDYLHEMDTLAESDTMDSLCSHCSNLIKLHTSVTSPERVTEPPTFDTDGHPEIPVGHQPNVERLIESAKHCHLCRVIQEYWPLLHLLERYPDIKEDYFGSLTLNFELVKPVLSKVSWGLLIGLIRSPRHAFALKFDLTIMVSHPNSMKLIFISFHK